MKYTKYSDIPKAVSDGSWQCNYSLVRLVNQIEELVEQEGLQINPDFQRGHVWTEDQQIAFIEALLSNRAKNAKVIYLNIPDWLPSRDRPKNSNYKDAVIVDGLQRYTAIKRFINDEIKVFESYCSEFEDNIRMASDMIVNINMLQSKKQVLRWYLEMNSGGTPHTEEELRKVEKLLSLEKQISNFND